MSSELLDLHKKWKHLRDKYGIGSPQEEESFARYKDLLDRERRQNNDQVLA